MPIEQALYDPAAGLLARSPRFDDAWLPEVEKLALGFGKRPLGAACPLAMFARPFGRRLVAVVRVAERGQEALAFHFLILPSRLYLDLAGDPFLLCDAFPADWSARGELPSLEWTAGPPARRTVDQVRRVLDVVADRTQTLLGGVQALLDGGRLAFARPAPDPDVVRDLWALLPGEARAEMWPATFAFGNALGFHVVVSPDVSGPEFAGYVSEADAGDYPEGRYEFALQQAAEESDQASIDALFARRGRGQVLRVAILLLLAFLMIPPLVFLTPGCRELAEAPKKEKPRD
jgi:hypothetical protein